MQTTDDGKIIDIISADVQLINTDEARIRKEPPIHFGTTGATLILFVSKYAVLNLTIYQFRVIVFGISKID